MSIVKDLIFDIGMNNGDDTAHYLEKGFRVLAVEADPTLVERGRHRFAEAIRLGRLEIVNVAVGPREETALFWICDERREWNSFDRGIASRNGLPHHSIPVQCVRFRELLRQYGTPFYLKIDIEGHDHHCIEDLDPSHLPQYVSMEMWPLEFIFRLRDLGYTRFKLITQNDHSQLAVDLFTVRGLLKRRLRPFPGLYRVGRELASLSSSVKMPLRRSTSGNGSTRHFPFGSSGPFADETDGRWQTVEEVALTWVAYLLGNSRYGQPSLDIWHDLHAAL